MNKIFSRGSLFFERETGKNPLFWAVLLFSMLLKYGYYGFTYFPTVDDHNMYGEFSMMSAIDALLKYKMYTTRPAAVVLDTFVISRLWGNLWVILLGFTLLHFISCWLVYKILEKNNIRTGAAVAAIFALLPLANDAAYWIAASSRIVVGLFITLLAIYLLMKYVENQKSVLYLLGFTLANLISLGFYEQVIAFCFISTLFVFAYNFRKIKNKLIIAIPFINAALLGAYYIAFRNTGNMASRGTLVKSEYIKHTINVYKRIKELMTATPASQLKHGLINGFNLIVNDRAVVFALLLLLVSAAVGIFYARENIDASLKKNIIKFLLGLFLVFLPFAPFFVLQLIWIMQRNAFISIIGAALMLESFADVFFGRINSWNYLKDNSQRPVVPRRYLELSLRIVKGTAAGIAVFVFLLGNTAELNDYKNISNIDNELVHNITLTLEEAKGQEWFNYEAVVFNTKPIYITPTSRHFSNSTGSDWALTGAVSSIMRQPSIKMLYPVADGKNLQTSRDKLDRCILLGMDEGRNTFQLQGDWISGTEMELRQSNGRLFGRVLISQENIITFNLEKIND